MSISATERGDIVTHLLAGGRDLSHIYSIKVGLYCLSGTFDVVGN